MTEINLISAFVVGLLGGVHCVGMCGGIVGALSLGLSSQRQLPLLFAYNFGRIASYTVAGALMGALGFYFSGLLPVQAAQRVLLAFAGVFMVLLGLYLGGWWNLLSRVERLGSVLWRRIEPLGRGLLPVRSVRQALLLGLLWGWLPCGLVYSALVWTVASGGAVQGAALMLAFDRDAAEPVVMGVAAAKLQRWVIARDPGGRGRAGYPVRFVAAVLAASG